MILINLSGRDTWLEKLLFGIQQIQLAESLLLLLLLHRGRTYPLFEDIISYPYPGPTKGYYILSISRPQKRILYPIHIQAPKKDMDIYISFVKIFASIVTVSEQQKARTGSNAAHKSSTFYWIELKPWSISSVARKWQITAEMAETAVVKEKYCLWNPKSQALNVKKRI
jgi:hypothetical protein